MNAIISRALNMGIPAILGASAGVAGRTMLGTGVHESISVAVGDTLVPRFSVTTDSVLRVQGSNIIVAKCGVSHIYLRTWQRTTQRSADTVDVSACTESTVPLPDTRTVASMEVCFIPLDSATKYHLSADTSMDRAQIPFPCDSTASFAGPVIAPPQQHLGSIMFDTIHHPFTVPVHP